MILRAVRCEVVREAGNAMVYGMDARGKCACADKFSTQSSSVSLTKPGSSPR